MDIDAIPDRRLELMLVCAHPAIERAVRTPLMLEAVAAYESAIALTHGSAERQYLQHRRHRANRQGNHGRPEDRPRA